MGPVPRLRIQSLTLLVVEKILLNPGNGTKPLWDSWKPALAMATMEIVAREADEHLIYGKPLASRVSTSAIARTSGKCRGGTRGVFASFGTEAEPSCQAGCSKPYCKPLAPSTDQSLELQSCKSRLNSQEENMKTTTSTLGILLSFFPRWG
ncbi:hypothetical protein EK904_003299, partial [Melospiza melodia maxima]